MFASEQVVDQPLRPGHCPNQARIGHGGGLPPRKPAHMLALPRRRRRIGIAIGKQQARDAVARDNAVRTLEAMGGMLKLGGVQGEAAVVAHFNAVLDNLNAAMLDRHTTRDFSKVFEKYIHNGDVPPKASRAKVRCGSSLS